jgi:hypothetical protein
VPAAPVDLRATIDTNPPPSVHYGSATTPRGPPIPGPGPPGADAGRRGSGRPCGAARRGPYPRGTGVIRSRCCCTPRPGHSCWWRPAVDTAPSPGYCSARSASTASSTHQQLPARPGARRTPRRKQWGMMNETRRYPGQAWLWLYTFWYRIPPFTTSHNADAQIWTPEALRPAECHRRRDPPGTRHARAAHQPPAGLRCRGRRGLVAGHHARRRGGRWLAAPHTPRPPRRAGLGDGVRAAGRVCRRGVARRDRPVGRGQPPGRYGCAGLRDPATPDTDDRTEPGLRSAGYPTGRRRARPERHVRDPPQAHRRAGRLATGRAGAVRRLADRDRAGGQLVGPTSQGGRPTAESVPHRG